MLTQVHLAENSLIEEQSRFTQMETCPTENFKIYVYNIFGVFHDTFLNPLVPMDLYGNPFVEHIFG